MEIGEQMRQLVSTVSSSGELTLALREVPVPVPSGADVLVRVEAAPINPSDLSVLLPPGVDLSAAQQRGSADRPEVVAPIAPATMAYLSARIDRPMVAGNEGAGLVVSAGSDPAAQALIGRRVAFFTGTAFSEYQLVSSAAMLPLPEGTDAASGASAFVNPQTAIAIVETTKREGGGAVVLTAAASNLGAMVNRLCQSEDLPLIGIVRRSEQASQLRAEGVTYALDSSAESFVEQLTEALVETGSTCAFDAIGGGGMANTLLMAMETAQLRRGVKPGRYGTTVRKRVHIFGGLGSGSLTLSRAFGMAWSVDGWLVSDYLQTLDAQALGALRQRVVDGLGTTFASPYSDRVSLVEALNVDAVRAYGAQATGRKFLLTP